jgi:hypothetical protein
MISDMNARKELIPKALEMIHQPDTLSKLRMNIIKLAQKDSADRIAIEILKLV